MIENLSNGAGPFSFESWQHHLSAERPWDSNWPLKDAVFIISKMGVYNIFACTTSPFFGKSILPSSVRISSSSRINPWICAGTVARLSLYVNLTYKDHVGYMKGGCLRMTLSSDEKEIEIYMLTSRHAWSQVHSLEFKVR